MSSRMGPALVAVTAVALAAAVPSSAQTAHAASLHTCHVGQRESEHFGPSYVTSIRVSHVSCTTGKAVVRAFQKCRKAHGGIKRGRCPRGTSVLGFHCSEKRGGIRTELTGKVTCASGNRRVVHTYTQFT